MFGIGKTLGKNNESIIFNNNDINITFQDELAMYKCNISKITDDNFTYFNSMSNITKEFSSINGIADQIAYDFNYYDNISYIYKDWLKINDVVNLDPLVEKKECGYWLKHTLVKEGNKKDWIVFTKFSPECMSNEASKHGDLYDIWTYDNYMKPNESITIEPLKPDLFKCHGNCSHEIDYNTTKNILTNITGLNEENLLELNVIVKPFDFNTNSSKCNIGKECGGGNVSNETEQILTNETNPYFLDMYKKIYITKDANYTSLKQQVCFWTKHYNRLVPHILLHLTPAVVNKVIDTVMWVDRPVALQHYNSWMNYENGVNILDSLLSVLCLIAPWAIGIVMTITSINSPNYNRWRDQPRKKYPQAMKENKKKFNYLNPGSYVYAGVEFIFKLLAKLLRGIGTGLHHIFWWLPFNCCKDPKKVYVKHGEKKRLMNGEISIIHNDTRTKMTPDVAHAVNKFNNYQSGTPTAFSSAASSRISSPCNYTIVPKQQSFVKSSHPSRVSSPSWK